MDCPVSTYSFIERLTECVLYGFSLTQVLLLIGLAVAGAGYAIWEHRQSRWIRLLFTYWICLAASHLFAAIVPGQGRPYR